MLINGITNIPPAEELYIKVLSLQEENAELRAQVAWFQRQMFAGSRSEKLPVEILTQAKLGLPETPQAEPSSQVITYERRCPAPEKRPMPAEVFANLPATETIALVPDEVKAEPAAFEQISEERTFEVDLIGPKLVKREIVRPKFRRKADRDQAPVIAPALPRPVTGGYAAAGLIAYIVISKYQHHLPLYRQAAMSTQWGALLSRQTMVDWRLTRRHGELTTLLTNDYAGLMQSDGYEAYAAYARTHPGVVWLGCWAHARRRFFEAQQDHPRIAQAALRLIGRLYRREREWDERKLSPEDRATERAKPEGLARTMHSLRRLALWARQRVLPKSTLGKACDYLLGQWEPPVRHLHHGESRLDNNLVENAIRPSCIGKKNWLFIGHPEAGQRSAILYSLIVSCQRHGKDPLAYLKDILTRLPRMTNQDDLTQLTPRRWQPATT